MNAMGNKLDTVNLTVGPDVKLYGRVRAYGRDGVVINVLRRTGQYCEVVALFA